MEVEFRLTREDYLEFIRYYIFQSRLAVKIILILFICFASISVPGVFSTTQTVINRLLFVFVALLVWTFVVPYARMRLGLDRSATKRPEIFWAQKISLDNDGIHRLRNGIATITRYDSISHVGMSAEFVYAIVPHSGYVVIPINSFQSMNEAVNFYGRIKGEYSRLNGHAKKLKSLYSWGWFGLVPVFGGVFGLVLMLRGIFEFKDKRLVLIGTLGLSFTILVCSFINKIENNHDFTENFIMMSNYQMDELVKEVEFYKVQNGVYPDSLQQLNKQKAPTSVYDPFLSVGKGFDMHSTGTYHYQNLGSKYTLFSVGPDGLPNTKDDIYPNLKINDTGKCGLVINRVSKQ